MHGTSSVASRYHVWYSSRTPGPDTCRAFRPKKNHVRYRNCCSQVLVEGTISVSVGCDPVRAGVSGSGLVVLPGMGSPPRPTIRRFESAAALRVSARTLAAMAQVAGNAAGFEGPGTHDWVAGDAHKDIQCRHLYRSGKVPCIQHLLLRVLSESQSVPQFIL